MQEKDITYLGVSNRPNEFLSKEGELADCINLVSEGGELRPISHPKLLYTVPSDYQLLYVHKVNSVENHIFENNGIIYYRDDTGDIKQITEITKEIRTITSVGNTLCIGTGEGILYIIWKIDRYVILGYKPPFPNISFTFEDSRSDVYEQQTFSVSQDDFLNGTDIGKQLFKDAYFAFTNRLSSKAENENMFCKPFLVTYAYKLYDGSHIMQSSPVFITPGFMPVGYTFYSFGSGDPRMITIGGRANQNKLLYQFSDFFEFPYLSKTSSINEWSDIIESLDIFISPYISTYDESRPVFAGKHFGSSAYNSGPILSNATGSLGIGFYVNVVPSNSDIGYCFESSEKNEANGDYLWPFPRRTNRDLIEDISKIGNFYKISSLSLEDLIPSSDYKPVIIRDGILKSEVLVNQEELKTDYYSSSILVGDIFSYNKRLNVVMSERNFGYPFPIDSILPYSTTLSFFTIQIYITVGNDKKCIFRLGSSDEKVSYNRFFPYYLFIPVPDVKEIDIFVTSQYLDTETSTLKTMYRGRNIKNVSNSKFLNGSVWVDDIPTKQYNYNYYLIEVPQYTEYSEEDYNLKISEFEEKVSLSGKNVELYESTIQTSEVNSPFTFKATGVSSIGVSKIVATAISTRALSAGQYGQFPLYVFAEDGIWALSVGSDGYFSSVTPISADVCNNPKSVCQLDGGVAFTTDKGLMLISGSDIRCISEDLFGQSFSLDENGVGLWPEKLGAEPFNPSECNDISFSEYLKGCIISYDYSNSRLLLCNLQKNYQWIYSLNYGTYSKMCFQNFFKTSIQTAPSYILQDNEGGVYAFESESSDNTTSVGAFLVSRPIRMNTPELKTIRKIIHRHTIDKTHKSGEFVKMRLFGTRDMIHFYEIRSLNGIPMLAYRIVLYFRIKPWQRYSASSIFFNIKTKGSPV